jgi:hypothetical protein
MENILETKYIKISLENEVILCIWKEVDVDIEVAKLMIDERVNFSNGKTYPCLSDIRNIKSLSKEARVYFAGPAGAKLMTACAILIDSPVSKLIGNFFISISKPIIPNKIFNKKEEALKWLEQFKEKKVK